MIILFSEALILSFLTSLGLIYISHKFKIFMDYADESRPQNFHTDITPRAGGISILAGLLFYLGLPFGSTLFFSVLLAFGSGIFEDFHRSLSPKFRLLLQMGAAFSAIILTDAVVTYLGLGIYLPYWLGMIFSIFAIAGMMNAINIIDGFNGLASGVVLLILLSFSFTTYQQQNSELLSVIIVTTGATIGFFITNFPKGKIFLGDGGAYLLGFIIAIIGIFLASKYTGVSPWYVLAVFIYPVWEVLFSMIRKTSMGRSPMQPDNLHLHMLIYRQITHNNPKTALFILLSLTPFITLSTLYPNKSNTNIAIALFFIISYSLLYRYLYHKDQTSQTTIV